MSQSSSEQAFWNRVYYLRDTVGLSYFDAQETALAEQREARQLERSRERAAEYERRESRAQRERDEHTSQEHAAFKQVLEVYFEQNPNATLDEDITAAQMAVVLEEVHARHGADDIIPYLAKVMKDFGFTVEQLRAAASGLPDPSLPLSESKVTEVREVVDPFR